MKTSVTKLKSSFFLAFYLLSSVAWSKPVAQVIEVKGQVFSVSVDGKTKSVKVNDHLDEQDEILVGEEGSLTLNDYYDATYHLIEGSHVKFFNKSVQLKKGKTWIQSLNSKHPLVLTTANGHIDFWKGEFIASFDQATSRTQILVVNGEVEVSHVLDKNMKYNVTAGTFSQIDPEVENGVPRAPTKVGLNSLNVAMAEFKILPAKLIEPAPLPKREIASVLTTPKASKQGEIIFLANGKLANRLPASVSPYNYFKKKISAKKVNSSAVQIRFYGFAPVELAKKNIAPRHPASIKKSVTIEGPKKVDSELNIDADFSKSLRIEQASQPKHSKELDSLIHDLKSF